MAAKSKSSPKTLVSKSDEQSKRQLCKPLDLDSMSRADARVEIAKDVLAAIRLKRLSGAYAGYVSVETAWSDTVLRFSDSEQYRELRDLIADNPNNDRRPILACAAGALLVAVVARNDAFAVPTRYARPGVGYGFLPIHEATRIRDRIGQYFDAGQLALIEIAYEGSSTELPLGKDVDVYPTLKRRAECFGDNDGLSHYTRSTERLEAIMLNIVDNGGIFVP